MRAQYAYNRAQVLWLTGMTDEELSAHQLDEGSLWLEAYTGGNPEAVAALETDPLVWKWWLNEWNRRDDTLCLSSLYRMADAPPFARKAAYMGYHAAIYIQNSLPHTLLEQSYQRILKKPCCP